MEEMKMRNLSSSNSEDEKALLIRGKVYRMLGRGRPLHMVFGGGKGRFLCFALIPPPPMRAADVLLWRNKKVSGGILGGATAIWFLFEVVEYHFVSFICHALILASSFLFFWSNAANFIGCRSLPEIQQPSVPEGPVVKLTCCLRMEMNRAISLLRDVASGRDFNKFLIAIAGLWIVSVAGRYCDFLTLVYTVMLVGFSVPRLYEKYEDEVEALAAEVQKHYAVFDAKVLSIFNHI